MTGCLYDSLFECIKKSIDAVIALAYGACKTNINLHLFEPFRGRVISNTVGLRNYWFVGAVFSREWHSRANIDNRGWKPLPRAITSKTTTLGFIPTG
jgi:hypothetical protein